MPFGRGSTGDGVRQLQEKLNVWIDHHRGTATDTGLIGFIDGALDGVFGENTQTVLAMYQKRNPPLGSSGFADCDTLKGLGLPCELDAAGNSAATLDVRPGDDSSVADPD